MRLTHDRSDQDADVEDHRQDQEGSTLVLLFLDDLTDHGPHHADIAVQYATKTSKGHCHGETARKAKANDAKHCAKQPKIYRSLSATVLCIRESAP